MYYCFVHADTHTATRLARAWFGIQRNEWLGLVGSPSKETTRNLQQERWFTNTRIERKRP